jgi:hypothetical protein
MHKLTKLSGAARYTILLTFLLLLASTVSAWQSLGGSPIPVKKVTFPELRYRILEHFGRVWFCDPDMFPIARIAKEKGDALQAFPNIQKDTATFDAIAKHLQLKGIADLSVEQKLTVYREYKKLLGATRLEAAGDKFGFKIGVKDKDGDFGIEGTIDRQGQITVLKKDATFLTCPMCLAAGTLIDTPVGPVPVEDLQLGMVVWTVDAKSHKVAMPVIKTTAVSVLPQHHVIHLVLKDNRELWLSPGHPTTDGRTVSQLEKSTSYDGGTVELGESVPYWDSQTYDLLPAGETGFYWANGILLASTLR